ncbi:hypothetical protein ACFWDG_18970 [Peribacillus sp. NPDC060186]
MFTSIGNSNVSRTETHAESFISSAMSKLKGQLSAEALTENDKTTAYKPMVEGINDTFFVFDFHCRCGLVFLCSS